MSQAMTYALQIYNIQKLNIVIDDFYHHNRYILISKNICTYDVFYSKS